MTIEDKIVNKLDELIKEMKMQNQFSYKIFGLLEEIKRKADVPTSDLLKSIDKVKENTNKIKEEFEGLDGFINGNL